MELDEIGIAVAEERKRRGLTQLEVARRAQVSRATMDILENGRGTDLGYGKLARILAALGLELRLQPASTERPTLEDLLKEDGADD